MMPVIVISFVIVSSVILHNTVKNPVEMYIVTLLMALGYYLYLNLFCSRDFSLGEKIIEKIKRYFK